MTANEIAGDDKEDINSGEPASQMGNARVIENDANDRDGAKSVNIGTIRSVYALNILFQRESSLRMSGCELRSLHPVVPICPF